MYIPPQLTTYIDKHAQLRVQQECMIVQLYPSAFFLPFLPLSCTVSTKPTIRHLPMTKAWYIRPCSEYPAWLVVLACVLIPFAASQPMSVRWLDSRFW